MSVTETLNCSCEVISSVSLSPLGSVQGGVVGYPEVMVLNGEQGENGRSVHTFTGLNTYQVKFPFTPLPNDIYKYGHPLKTVVYDAAGTLLTKSENKYAVSPIPANKFKRPGLKVQYQVLSHHPMVSAGINVGTVFALDTFFIISDWQYLQEKTDTTFFGNGAFTASRETYEYSPSHLQRVKTTTRDSQGREISERIIYPGDINTGVYAAMKAKNILKTPIITERRLRVGANEWVTGYAKTEYAGSYGGHYPAALVKREKTAVTDAGTDRETGRIQVFDRYGNGVQFAETGGSPQSSVYGHRGQLLLA
ncbi:MAG TPA: hypothetical protein VD772_05295, partial [Anseongella sp.]|nr:hypothetical protein [Anseongella sp.]